MDLASFAKIPPESNGAFLKFTAKENIKIVRFCYERAEDIKCRQKYYDPSTRKVIWDTPEGKWMMNLKVAVYKSKTEFEIMTWDRSAAFGRDTLLPLFEAAGGDIIDTVYKITCSKAGTIDATYSFFPLRNSEDYAMPDLSPADEIADEEVEDEEIGDEELDEDEIADEEEDEEPAFNKKKSAPASTGKSTTSSTSSKASAATGSGGTTQKSKKRNFWEE